MERGGGRKGPTCSEIQSAASLSSPILICSRRLETIFCIPSGGALEKGQGPGCVDRGELRLAAFGVLGCYGALFAPGLGVNDLDERDVW